MIQVDGKRINHLTFNGGEQHVKLDPATIGESVSVLAWLYSAQDIMLLMLTMNAIRHININTNIFLKIPYFPYARQDRICEPGEAFSVEVMVSMINSLQADRVVIVDPHSQETVSRLNNVIVETQTDIIRAYAHKMHMWDTCLVAPDLGAKSKVRELAKAVSKDAIYCTKVRDTKTGNITDTIVPVINKEWKDKYLIIDDICDGGRTFIELAKKFKQLGIPRERMELYVTHGIFSKGFTQLKEYFSHIYCYHMFPVTKHTNSFDKNYLIPDSKSLTIFTTKGDDHEVSGH